MLTGAIVLICGLIDSCNTSIITRKYKHHKLLLLLSVTTGNISYFILFFILKTENIGFILIFGAFVGLCEIPSRGLMIALECEVAYPISKIH